MYYSITFTNESGEKKNTWADWRLIPSSPPMIEPPEPYTNFVDIPGRAFGPIDLSEVLTGKPSFQMSEGSWDFIADDEAHHRTILFQELKKFFHGRKIRLELEEDPLHYYEGLFAVAAPKTGKGNVVYSISYSVFPVRYNLDGTVEGV